MNVSYVGPKIGFGEIKKVFFQTDESGMGKAVDLVRKLEEDDAVYQVHADQDKDAVLIVVKKPGEKGQQRDAEKAKRLDEQA